MTPNSPAVLISSLTKPVMTKELQVRVVGLVRRVMDVKLGPFKKEKAMMVHELLPAI